MSLFDFVSAEEKSPWLHCSCAAKKNIFQRIMPFSRSALCHRLRPNLKAREIQECHYLNTETYWIEANLNVSDSMHIEKEQVLQVKMFFAISRTTEY